MREYCYIIKELPDLSLAKYTGMDNSGTSGVIGRHTPFLKQLHAIGMMTDASFHLFYIMDTEKEKGNRLTVALMCRVGIYVAEKEECNDEERKYYLSLINSTSLGEFFCFSVADDSIFPSYKFQSHAFLSRQAIVKNTLDERVWDRDKPYSISKWKVDPKGRLYNLLKLIEMMGKNVVYRVDLYPVNYTEKIATETTSYMSTLKQKASYRSTSSSTELGMKKDDVSDVAHRKLKDFLEPLTESLHFSANITVLHDDPKTAGIILEYIASEIIEEGSYKTDCVIGGFNCCDNMEKESVVAPVVHFEKFKFLQTLFSVEDIMGFFSLPVLFDNENIELRKESDPKLNSRDVFLGNNSNGYPVYLSLDVFAKHAYISGVPGSGKTFTMKHLITSLYENNVPFLIFEPAKREYRQLFEMECGLKNEMAFFSPKSGSKFPLNLNPFQVPKGITVSEHISHLIEVFEGAFDLLPPTPFLLNNAIESVYRKKGWRFSDKGENVLNREGLKKEYPRMSEVYDEIENFLETTDYGEENKGNLKSVVQMRLGSLLTRERREIFDCNTSSFDPEKWIEKYILLELESLGSSVANFVTLLITTLIRETLKANPNPPPIEGKPQSLRHVIFFEEAHNLIGPVAEKSAETADAKAASTEFIVKMLAEVRALKEGIVIADQLPTSIAPQVLKNTGLKIAHRQMSEEERRALGQVMSADKVQIERLAKFSKGQCLITYEGKNSDEVSKPFEVQIKSNYSFSSDSPDDDKLAELLIDNKYRKSILKNAMIHESDELMNTIYRILQEVDKRYSSLNDNCAEVDKIYKEYAGDPQKRSEQLRAFKYAEKYNTTKTIICDDLEKIKEYIYQFYEKRDTICIAGDEIFKEWEDGGNTEIAFKQFGEIVNKYERKINKKWAEFYESRSNKLSGKKE